MRIAIFYDTPFSGAKRLVLEQAKGLRALGNSVDVYTTDSAKDIFDPGLEANNKYFYKFSPSRLKFPILERIKNDFIDTCYSLKKLHKQIAKDIDSKGYDVVLVNIDTHTQAPFLLRFLNTKNVYYCLEPLRNAYEYSLRFKGNFSLINIFYENLNRLIRKNLDRKNTHSAKKILTISLFARERIIAAYDLYPKVSYLGVDETVFKPVGVKKNNQVFFVAEKYSIYGYDLAKMAINLIPVDIRPKLKIISWKKNNEARLSDKELASLYCESLVTLSLSRFDTFGLVPLESMACGVPVVALNVGGYREIVINGQNGFLVDFDPKQIAERVIFLIKNSDKAKKMGEQGRKSIEENWTWEKQIKLLNNILKDYVDKDLW